MTSTATVFISYAWESDAFRAQVKALRDYLLANGVAVVSDFDHAIKPPELGWAVWMQQSIQDAAVVLVVCSASYKPRFEKRAPPTSGKGVAWEGAVITQDLYNAAQRNNKFYPIFPDPFNFDHCPMALEPWCNGHAFPSKQTDILALVHTCLGVAVAPAGAPGAPSAANPFDPRTPAVGSRFFGRQDFFNLLQNALEETRSVSIVGDRRIGKTSLLLAWQVKAQTLGRMVRIVDGLDAGMLTCSGLVQAITDKKIESDEAEAAANALAIWAEQCIALPPLILLDEAEAMLGQLPHRFFERLRGLIGRRKLCLVLTTAQPVDQVFKEVGRTSPFANILEAKSLGLLAQSAAEQMMMLGDAMFDDSHRALMRTWAGRHPFFLTLCGRHIWNACRNGVAHEQMMDELCFEAAGQFRQLWLTLNEKERQ
ncbi:MAG: hypothetical protein RL748_1398, partial [Pseudomonadota bacterium]